MTTRVLVVDDHELLRQGVISTLDEAPRFEVAGEAASADEGVDKALELRPDLVLLDISMPGGSGLAVLPRVKDALPQALVVMLTVAEDPATVTEALKAGANGYLVKGIRAEAFIEALISILAGESYVSPAVAGRILREAHERGGSASDLETLTPRELEVLDLLAQGRSNRDIAEALVISEKTVKRHVTGILAKLHARNRTEAALRAIGRELRATTQTTLERKSHAL
jgi:DNA-binding NarL/FixJ family response regulator